MNDSNPKAIAAFRKMINSVSEQAKNAQHGKIDDIPHVATEWIMNPDLFVAWFEENTPEGITEKDSPVVSTCCKFDTDSLEYSPFYCSVVPLQAHNLMSRDYVDLDGADVDPEGLDSVVYVSDGLASEIITGIKGGRAEVFAVYHSKKAEAIRNAGREMRRQNKITSCDYATMIMRACHHINIAENMRRSGK